MVEAPGWREQARNIFQTSVCSLTGSKVSSNANSKIEYIEDFAEAQNESERIHISAKNQRFNGFAQSDEYGYMGKFADKEGTQTDEEVVETGDKNAYHDTPDLKVNQAQKSSIQTVPSALEEFVHGIENQKQYSNIIDKLRESQDSKKDALNDSGKVKMFSTKLNPQNKILNQQRRIGRMSPPLPCQSNYAQHQGDTAMRGRNKTVERHIVDLNQLKNELGGTSSCYHVLGDGADKTLKVVQFGSGKTFSIYNSQRERSKDSFGSLLSKNSRVKSNSTVEVPRDRQPPFPEDELNLNNLLCVRQISSDCAQAKAYSINIQQNKYGMEDANQAEIESPGLARGEGKGNILERMNIDAEISSEEADSEYQREKQRQEQTRRMIEQAKQNRKKCIDDSSSSSSVKSVHFEQNVEIQQDYDDDFDGRQNQEEIRKEQKQVAVDNMDDLSSCKDQNPFKDSTHENYLNADVQDQLALDQPVKSSINLQKIIMENNKNTQRWDMPDFSDGQSNDSETNAKILIVEEEDDPMDHDHKAKGGSQIRSLDYDDPDYEGRRPSDHQAMNNSDDGSDVVKEEENYQEQVQRIPTPINKMSGYQDKENRLESIKDYLKNDN